MVIGMVDSLWRFHDVEIGQSGAIESDDSAQWFLIPVQHVLAAEVPDVELGLKRAFGDNASVDPGQKDDFVEFYDFCFSIRVWATMWLAKVRDGLDMASNCRRVELHGHLNKRQRNAIHCLAFFAVTTPDAFQNSVLPRPTDLQGRKFQARYTSSIFSLSQQVNQGSSGKGSGRHGESVDVGINDPSKCVDHLDYPAEEVVSKRRDLSSPTRKVSALTGSNMLATGDGISTSATIVLSTQA
ncbi:hypothetical protein MMC13_007686 [Lambiella insularis]|nr:hypothetical protein [Lambiella insularis]